LPGLVIGADVVSSPGNLHRFRFPQGECVDRASRSVTTGFTVTITHGFGCATDCKLHGTTETAALVRLFFVHILISPGIFVID
jgi:hypothetical protein